MTQRTVGVAVAVAVLFVGSHAGADDNWPQWRGPDQNGVSTATNLPTTWSLEQNVAWKRELPAWSGGTPIIWGDHIFLTSPSPSEAQPAAEAQPQQEQPRRRRRRGFGRDPGGQKLLLLSISRTDGSIEWQREVDEGNRLWRKGNNSSPSPVTDGKHVWVVTGNGQINAYDFDGNPVWQTNLQQSYGTFGHNWGYASSPLLYDGKLIVEVLHGMKTDDPSYVVAFDAQTGKELWRQERPTDAPSESPDAYTTPVLLEHDGQAQIVISGGDYVTGHDPDTGQEIWRAAGLNPRREGNYRIIASPLAVDGIIYAPTRETPLLAIKAGSIGDATNDLAWTWDSAGGPDVPTPICDGKFFYMVDDGGMVTCVDAKTGKAIWGPKRTTRGTVSASPILADGKIYFTNEQAVTTVLAAGPEFKVLATNELDSTYTLSSPVAVGNQLFIRTSTHLYCIANPAD